MIGAWSVRLSRGRLTIFPEAETSPQTSYGQRNKQKCETNDSPALKMIKSTDQAATVKTQLTLILFKVFPLPTSQELEILS